ncbi:MAG: hypothetical protein U5K69_13245 [Balneolaceae bacterium]|nr:hypothetical protein [Balneolaceae bacterium]
MEQTKAAASKVSNTETPRIEPIEKPSSIKLKLAYWFTKQQMGKVITPLKVVQARIPKTLSVSQKMMGAEDNLSLPDDLIFFIKSYVSTLNGCAFCIDLAKAGVEDERTVKKYEQLLNYESADEFNKAEKAALKFVEQATCNKEVSEEVFERVNRYFNDQEIVEMTWLNATQNYYNLINKPLKIGSDNLCNV